MPLNTVTGWLSDIKKGLAILESIWSRFTPNEAEAALGIAGSLAEVRKTWLAIDVEITDFLTAALDPDPTQGLTRALLHLDGGQASARLDGARGRSSRIRNFYDNHIDKMASKVLDQAEYAIFSEFFDTLTNADLTMFVVAEELLDWLKEVARTSLDQLQAGDSAAAHQIALSSVREVRRMRRQVNDLVSSLGRLEDEFIQISGV